MTKEEYLRETERRLVIANDKITELREALALARLELAKLRTPNVESCSPTCLMVHH